MMVRRYWWIPVLLAVWVPATLVAAPVVAADGQATLRVTNPTALIRKAEVVDLPLLEVNEHMHADVKFFSAHLKGSNEELLTQLYASRVGGPVDRLLVLVDLAPSQTVVLELKAVNNAPHAISRVQAREVPERADDFAWENDVVAFRVYGPALQRTGEIASGIDVWSKRVPDFVTKSWYERDAEGARTHHPELSYHRDNGQGLDSYEVGASRGCGATAVWSDGKLIASKNYTTARILAEGPIRADFVLDYAPWPAAGVTVRESKRITLDAGARLNHMRSTFAFEGATTLTVAAGIAMHADAVLHQPDEGIASVWDTPQLASAGHIGTAMVMPTEVLPRFATMPMEGQTAGDALFLFDVHSGDSVDYFAGSAWSQGGTPTQADFDRDLSNTRERLEHPVVVGWTSRP